MRLRRVLRMRLSRTSTAAVIEQLRPELERVRKKNGRLILAGFAEAEMIEGFAAREILRREEWVCVVC